MAQDFIRNTNQVTRDKKNPMILLGLDLPLLIPMLLLVVYGLYILYSASGQDPSLVIKQGIRITLGLLLMWAIVQVPQGLWIKLSPILYCAGILLLVIVLFFGTDAKGAQRWITIPGIARFQPSELMKLVIPLTLASLLSHKPLPPTHGSIALASALIVLPTFLIAKQPDLGTALLIAYSGFMTLILAGLSWRYLAVFFVVSIPSAFLFWQFFMHSYQKTRVLTLLDPSADPLGAGWNIIQSQAAIGSGGMNGKGWLQGTQSQLNFLPESSTDFIIAVIAEELGFKGVLLLLLLYTLICIRGLVIAWSAENSFGKLLAGTLTFTFFIYIFVNIGMVSGILPVVGVPLPLVSYGGSSVVSLMAAFGLIMSIHAQHNL